jgi:hypothetical protein
MLPKGAVGCVRLSRCSTSRYDSCSTMHKSKRFKLSPSLYEKLLACGGGLPRKLHLCPAGHQNTIRHEVVTRIDDLMNNYIRRTTIEGYDVHFV